jgi:hypothetical protein
MTKGFRTSPLGGVAAPPYTNGPYTFSEDITFNGNLRKTPSRYCLEESFKQIPNANASISIVYNLNFELLGTNADVGDFSWSTTCGGLLLETGSADNDQVIILPHLDTKQTAWTGVKWGTENQVIWESTIRTTAVITPVLIWAGLKLTNTPVIATDDNQVLFRYSTDDSDTTIRCISSIGGVDTNTDSGITVEANTTYNLRVEIDSDRKAHFYINDVEVYTSAALTNDIDLIPYIGLMQLGAGDSSLTLVDEKISRIIFE